MLMAGTGAAARALFVDQSAVISGGELSLLDLARFWPTPAKVVLFADGPFRNRLQQASVAVDVMIPGAGMRKLRRGSGVAASMRGLPALAVMVAKLAREARNFEALYANSQKAFMVAALAARLARRPCIWHLRDILSREHFSATAIRAAVLLANSSAARVITDSRATAEAFVAAGGRRALVKVVYNGFEMPALERRSAEVRALRSQLLGDGTALIGVFGRLSPWKGQHVVLDALSRLPGVHLVVVGGALFGEVEYAAELRRHAAAAGLESRVHFLGHRDDVAQLMAAVDVVVHSSVAPEPFGRVIVEAMLAQRPVVATAGGGVVEIIDNKRNGLLVPPGDAAKMAEAVQRLLGDEAEAARMAAAGQCTALQRFTIQKMVSDASAAVSEAVAAARWAEERRCAS